MIVTIQPSGLSGVVRAPASKSSMQRACAAALVAGGESILLHPGHSNDDKAALEIIQRLGAEVEGKGEEMLIRSRGIHPVQPLLDCRESGLSIRMFTVLAAVCDREMTITGSGSLAGRPLHFLQDVLPLLGVTVRSNGGLLPLQVRGPLQPRDLEVDGSLSSQYLTGLLFAYAAAGASGVTIRVKDLKSKPYIDLTLSVMKAFGLPLPENRDYRAFYFPGPAGQSFPAKRTYTVEADWSGAAFLLVAGALAGPITVTGLDLVSTQADRVILDALMQAGAGIAMEAKGIRIHPSPLKGFELDATDCPDLFPPLAALAAYCQGSSRIRGVGRLLHKESNRAVTLQQEMGNMGVRITCEGDVMTVEGGGIVRGAAVHSHHDHRIAMACAVAALRAKGPTEIGDGLAVRKSYPDFYNDLKKLGANVSLPFQTFNF